MVELRHVNQKLQIYSKNGDLASRHESQLAFWGFNYDAEDCSFSCHTKNMPKLLSKIANYFQQKNISFHLDGYLQSIVDENIHAKNRLNKALQKGKRFKAAGFVDDEGKEFAHFINTNLKRPLKEHQFKAALHLLYTRNGANFSVPGSGKTSVVLAVFLWLRSIGVVDSLFVVGPPAIFGPWCHEYEALTGREPRHQFFSGGDIGFRRSRYLQNKETVPDLNLITFQTLQRDSEHIQTLFSHQGINFYFVVDEAHYIKQLEGSWANAVLDLSAFTTRSCILTGTPFPKSYTDAFNLFDVLWPSNPPIEEYDRQKIDLFVREKDYSGAANILNRTIGPLFYRVRKSELGLAPQDFKTPLCVPMNKYEQIVYNFIYDKISEISEKDYFKNAELLMRLRRGRMIRLRQCVSYPKLLGSAVEEYNENLLNSKLSLADIIKHYDSLECPAKLEKLRKIVSNLIEQGERVVVWSNFIGTLKLLHNKLSDMNYQVRLIYGGTPVESASLGDELTREKIINEFVDPAGNIDVLVANPAACAESISLHKMCSNAIYYDLSYNCARYIQSLDRIHRVGGSENKPSHYYFLQYEDSIETDILSNIQRKANNMNSIIEKDYEIYSLDMFSDDDELDAYERIFGTK